MLKTSTIKCFILILYIYIYKNKTNIIQLNKSSDFSTFACKSDENEHRKNNSGIILKR